MKHLICILICLGGLFSETSFAQNYENAIGLRFGPMGGISYKHSIDGIHGIEAILSTRWRGFNLTGLYERHIYVSSFENFYFVVGVGGHAGYWNGNWAPFLDENNNAVVVGVDAMAGAEFTFDSLPVSISLDYKPALNLIGHFGIWQDNLGISLRYTF